MLPIGESTMYRIFIPWLVYMEAVLSHLNLSPVDKFLVFIKTGCDLTDAVIG